jgi:hypothetical protein
MISAFSISPIRIPVRPEAVSAGFALIHCTAGSNLFTFVAVNL